MRLTTLTISSNKIREITIRFFRFAKVGIFVTILSLALSYFFLKILATPLYATYVFLKIAMVLLSYILNSKYTFGANRNIKGGILYFLAYGISALFGIVLLWIFRKLTPFENWILAYMVVPFTTVANFILSSLIFKNKND